MEDDLNEEFECEEAVAIDVPGEICGFCNEASECLQTMRDLYDTLERLEDLPEIEPKSNEVRVSEIRIARTLISLFSEYTAKLSCLATDGKANLKMMLESVLEAEDD